MIWGINPEKRAGANWAHSEKGNQKKSMKCVVQLTYKSFLAAEEQVIATWLTWSEAVEAFNHTGHCRWLHLKGHGMSFDEKSCTRKTQMKTQIFQESFVSARKEVVEVQFLSPKRYTLQN